ncbi:MAG: hypothetical protein NVS2B15_26640 [Pseudarthrobacter sp.]
MGPEQKKIEITTGGTRLAALFRSSPSTHSPVADGSTPVRMREGCLEVENDASHATEPAQLRPHGVSADRRHLMFIARSFTGAV